MPEIIQQESPGCLRRLALFVLLPLALLFAAVAGVSFWVLAKLDPFLSRKPLPMPEVTVSALEYQVLRGRIDAFTRAQAEGLPAEVSLSDREIAALFAKHDDWAWGRGMVFTRIENGRLFVFLSVPVARLPVIGIFGGGRYFNLIADTSPQVLKGRIDPDLQRAWFGDRAATPGEIERLRTILDRAIADPYPLTGRVIRAALRNLSGCIVGQSSLTLRCGGFGRTYEPPPRVTPPEPPPAADNPPAGEAPSGALEIPARAGEPAP